MKLEYTKGVAEGEDPRCYIGDVVASWEHDYGAAGHVCGLDPTARVIEVLWDDGRARVVKREWKHVDKVVFQFHAEEEPLECVEAGRDECSGEVEMRPPLSDSGEPYARCKGHWEKRLDKQEEINRRYALNSDVPPDGFDPAYAGERWDEDY